jgi:hypothetical protein
VEHPASFGGWATSGEAPGFADPPRGGGAVVVETRRVAPLTVPIDARAPEGGSRVVGWTHVLGVPMTFAAHSGMHTASCSRWSGTTPAVQGPASAAGAARPPELLRPAPRSLHHVYRHDLHSSVHLRTRRKAASYSRSTMACNSRRESAA